MRDVALRAGVSTATVSRALAPGQRIRADTRRRVLEAAAELGYQRNNLPRNMRARSSPIFGLVISDIANPFFTAMVRGCEDVAHKHGYALVLANTDEDRDREITALANLAAERVAGAMLASTDEDHQGIQQLLTVGIPVVAVDRRIGDLPLDTVTTDNRRGAEMAVAHLTALGHRRIAMVSGPTSVSSVRERERGYRDALQAAGIEPDPSLVVVGDLRESGGYTATARLLESDVRPTAIFSVNNLTTLGALHAIRDARLRVPDDLSIIGFDDVPGGDLFDPPLTVVEQATYTLGANATELLVQRITAQDSLPRQDVLVPARLLVRRSTSAPPGAPPSMN